MRPRIKICGITRAEDAALAVELGADAIGFVFWPRSPRAIAPADARAIERALPPLVSRVGVFVDATPGEVAEVVRAAGLDVVQLHGDEPVDRYLEVDARIVKVAPLRDDADVTAAAGWPAGVMPLVDAVDPDRRGGTGRRADWTLAARLASMRPLLLAGGLDADNVREAIRRVRPWGIDVSSGVERRPGVKDAERLRAFFAAVARAREEL